MISLAEISPNPNNPRLIKDERFKKLVDNIKRYPKFLEKRPIVIDSFENPIILGGNMRYKALQELGYKEIPSEWVKEAKDFSEEEKRAFIIIDNNEFGENDWDKLANEWDENDLKDWGLELPFNFSGDAQEDNYTVPDEIETDIVAGDLFEIGQHRLLCGDSTNADDVAKVMDGCKPILMVTDPPYGVNYDPTWRHKAGINDSSRTGKVENDHRCDWSAAYLLFTGDVAYVWFASWLANQVQESIEKCDFKIVNLIIWNKQQMVFGRGDYHWKHEPCWYAIRNGAKHHWNGDRKQTTVWDIENLLSKKDSDSNQIHGTQKPVECMARPIRNNTYERETVYDPFLGSGTTMVAAHQLNRKCIGIEISPQYCQIIVDRLLNLDPTLEVKRNGKQYSKKDENTEIKQKADAV